MVQRRGHVLRSDRQPDNFNIALMWLSIKILTFCNYAEKTTFHFHIHFNVFVPPVETMIMCGFCPAVENDLWGPIKFVCVAGWGTIIFYYMYLTFALCIRIKYSFFAIRNGPIIKWAFGWEDQFAKVSHEFCILWIGLSWTSCLWDNIYDFHIVIFMMDAVRFLSKGKLYIICQ